MNVRSLLERSRVNLVRLDAHQALAAQGEGALLVDIRPAINRDTEGQIPGALVIDRNVLEWRLDPASDARLEVAAYDRHIVLFCNEGYASSLAAASLQDLGITRATDLIGGFREWRAHGLPVVAARPS